MRISQRTKRKLRRIFWASIIFIFLVALPMNWPRIVRRTLVWSMGLIEGVPPKYLDLYVTHIGFESSGWKQYREEIPLVLGFSLGTPVVGNKSPDVGVGQLNPTYFPDNPITRWCMLCNLHYSARHFANGCTEKNCTDVGLVCHYTGKPVEHKVVQRTLEAWKTKPWQYSTQYLLVLLGMCVLGVIIAEWKK